MKEIINKTKIYRNGDLSQKRDLKFKQVLLF